MEPELLERLNAQDWKRLGRVLVRYALWRARINAWKEGARDTSVRLGRSAEDVVAAVIAKVFAGERTWDPARGELLPTLKRQVDSELDHLWKRQAGRKEVPAPEDAPTREAQEAHAASLDPFSEPSNPEAHTQRREELVTATARVTALFGAVADDPELQELIDAVLEIGRTEPRHLATHLGVPVKDVYNRLKRLRRRAIT